jgi:hypothetical protein
MQRTDGPLGIFKEKTHWIQTGDGLEYLHVEIDKYLTPRPSRNGDSISKLASLTAVKTVNAELSTENFKSYVNQLVSNQVGSWIEKWDTYQAATDTRLQIIELRLKNTGIRLDDTLRAMEKQMKSRKSLELKIETFGRG